jgi:hypothetical protein
MKKRKEKNEKTKRNKRKCEFFYKFLKIENKKISFFKKENFFISNNYKKINQKSKFLLILRILISLFEEIFILFSNEKFFFQNFILFSVEFYSNYYNFEFNFLSFFCFFLSNFTQTNSKI